ncbi:hypothetical protein BYT27DRAFT_7245012, partial [Phlegmacium glaucopus]
MATRITNVSKHPGEHQNQYNHKTTQEAQAERKKKEVEREEKQKLMEVVDDNTIEVRDGDLDTENSNKGTSIGTEVPVVEKKTKHLEEQKIYERVDEFESDAPAKIGAFDEYMSSGSDFEPAEESAGERGLGDVELEDDKPDTELANKKSGRKKRRGFLLEAMAANIKKPKQMIPSGVKSNWDKDEVLIPPFLTTHCTASSSSSASNAAGRRSMSSASVTTQSHNRSESKLASVQPGGISSGEDEVEHRYVINQTAVGIWYRSIAKIEEIEGASIITKRSTCNVKKSVHPTLKNLPSKTTNGFNNFVLYKAYNQVGELDAWATLPNDKIADLWNEVFGDIYPVSISADSCDGGDGNHLFTVIKKLISRGISSQISNRLDHAGFVINML